MNSKYFNSVNYIYESRYLNNNSKYFSISWWGQG